MLVHSPSLPPDCHNVKIWKAFTLPRGSYNYGTFLFTASYRFCKLTDFN